MCRSPSGEISWGKSGTQVAIPAEVPDMWVSHLGFCSLSQASLADATSWSRNELSSVSSTPSHIHEQINDGCFKPLHLKGICYAAINNWNRGSRRLSEGSSILAKIWRVGRIQLFRKGLVFQEDGTACENPKAGEAWCGPELEEAQLVWI